MMWSFNVFLLFFLFTVPDMRSIRVYSGALMFFVCVVIALCCSLMSEIFLTKYAYK